MRPKKKTYKIHINLILHERGGVINITSILILTLLRLIIITAHIIINIISILINTILHTTHRYRPPASSSCSASSVSTAWRGPQRFSRFGPFLGGERRPDDVAPWRRGAP